MKLSLRVWLARQKVAEKRFVRRSRRNDANADRLMAQEFARINQEREARDEATISKFTSRHKWLQPVLVGALSAHLFEYDRGNGTKAGAR